MSTPTTARPISAGMRAHIRRKTRHHEKDLDKVRQALRERPLSAPELASALYVERTTIYAWLRTLIDWGYVRRAEEARVRVGSRGPTAATFELIAR